MRKKLIITSKLRKIKHSNPHLNGEHNEENIQLTYQVLSSLQLKNLSKEFKKDTKVGSVPMYVDVYQKHKVQHYVIIVYNKPIQLICTLKSQ